MRCTKCSFISFDDLSACAKCANDLSNLSRELNGTCTETRQEFFLGSAIQSPGLDDDNFSDSQMLPPIAQGDMNFDDTSTGGFSALASTSSETTGYAFDDTGSVSAEDDVAIELGDIMPIDFDQLDSGSVLSEDSLEHTDSLALDDLDFNLDKTSNVSVSADKEIDFDFAGSFDESGENFQFDGDLSDVDIDDLSQDLPVVSADVNSSSSDETLIDVTGGFSEKQSFHLDQELFEQLSDASGSFDETISLNTDGGLNETQASTLAMGDEDSASFDLDESLVAELAGTSAQDVSGEFPMGYSDDNSASGDFELDAALVAELASDDAVAAKSTDDIFSATEQFSADTGEFENPLQFAPGSPVNEALSFDQVEDLTGEFPLIREEDAELSGLDLADIDVSDLLDPADKMSAADADSSLNLQPELLGGPSGPDSSAGDDTIRQEVGRPDYGQQDVQGDDALVFAGGLLDEEFEGEDFGSSVSDIDALAGEINLTEGNLPQDFSTASLDDTFRDGESLDVSFDLSEEDSADDILDEELVLDDAGPDEDLPVDIDGLALDADFEAFLNKTAKTASDDKLPEIELITDEDEDGPPDLPR